MPVVEFREKPVKEIYKKLIKKVNEKLDPKAKPIPNKKNNIFNMMMQAGGNTLDITKQICTVGHRAKCCKQAKK